MKTMSRYQIVEGIMKAYINKNYNEQSIKELNSNLERLHRIYLTKSAKELEKIYNNVKRYL